MRKRWLILMSMAIVAMLVLVACGNGDDDDDAEPTNTAAAGGAASTAPAAGGDATEMPGMSSSTTTVGMLDAMAFDPETLTVAAGEEVEIMLTNDGAIPHNMSVDDAGVDETLDGGESNTFSFTAPDEPGEYEIYCNVPGHREAGMVATLVVE